MKLQFFDKEGFKQIKSEWLKSLSTEYHEVSVSDYHQLFDLIEITEGWGGIDCRFNQPVFQAIVDDHGSTWAVVETIGSKRKSGIWVKVVDITMSPQHELGQVPDGHVIFKQRLSIFAAFLLGMFACANEETFIYGRTDALLVFLSGMHNPLPVLSFLGTVKEINVTIEDRWLVFSAK